MANDMDQRMVNVVKGLVMDATRKANSGHPGGAMSSADFAVTLFSEFLNFDPDDAGWFNRDRFVLSCGHESMLLYSLLHLAGFLSIDDLKDFRQLDSLTPGHPEAHLTPGVEATTGPLGQGFAMAVGMAAAEAHLAARLGGDVMDHFTYVLASDGDMQEPVATGAASLAGLWGLGKLIVFYDANQVQLAGPVARADCTDYKKIFEGYCWQVLEIDGHDRNAIRNALQSARLDPTRPTLIIGDTTIAKGTATREGDFNTHGAPLPPEEIAATKKALGLPEDQDFHVPEDVTAAFRARFDGLRDMAASWRANLDARLNDDEDFAAFWELICEKREDLSLRWPGFTPGEKLATRKAWGACLNLIKDQLPQLVGGSADLDPSNQTAQFREDTGVFAAGNRTGRNLAYGVREFPMAAINNGIALHGGLIPFAATFLTFSDYCRNALRMSALQELPTLSVFTHDSFWVGEDGPTHQPVEHISSLRLIPDMLDFRPADAVETAACLDVALKDPKRPSCLFLTRQGLPVAEAAGHAAIKAGVPRGAYVLHDCEGEPDILVIATGSEVSLAAEALALLPGVKARIVSMPSMTLFDEQDRGYRESVLPPSVTRRVAVEAGSPDLWGKYVGPDGLVVGMTGFGKSAPGPVLAEAFGFTPEALARRIKETFTL